MKLLFALLGLTACARPAIEARVVDKRPVETFIGLARDSKASAVLLTDDGRAFHIDGLDYWPAELEGRRVRVDGQRVEAARLPRASRDANGAWAQGVAPNSPPESWLDDARWTLVDSNVEAAPWTLRLSDGSGNETTVTLYGSAPTATWRYEPIAPAMSSSGVYSGGEPASGSLTWEEVEALWKMIRALEADTHAQVAERAKGTTRIGITGRSGEERSFIVRADAATELGALLAGLR